MAARARARARAAERGGREEEEEEEDEEEEVEEVDDGDEEVEIARTTKASPSKLLHPFSRPRDRLRLKRAARRISGDEGDELLLRLLLLAMEGGLGGQQRSI